MISTTRILQQVRRTLDEMSYAQRRSIELRTGVPQAPFRRVRRGAGTVEELERLWALTPRRG